MNSKKSMIAAFAAGLVITAAGWLLTRPHKTGGGTRPHAVPVNSTHEKVFLVEQLKRNQQHVPILLRLAEIQRNEGDLKSARGTLEQAAAADENNVEVRLQLGLVCSELGDLAAAEQQNRAILGTDAGHPDALYNLGAIAANRGDKMQARAFWNQAVRGGRNEDAVEKSRQAMLRLEDLR